ncbi:M4 family metallopeptidase [Candidatus Clostridium radicumherbarum]|uniref:M4 family metallopeptidase n=1 Tax=Candidatus Clostridium radicumherbarum TaxID=3381662 RepID=A0ABW8TWD0_9CLOT
MNKKVTALLASFVMLVSTATSYGSFTKVNAKELDKKGQIISSMQEKSSGKLKMETSDKNGHQIFISGRLSDKRIPSTDEAMKFVEENKELLDFKGSKNDLKGKNISKDELGYTHVKLSQILDGYEIKDRVITVHFDKDGYIVNFTGNIENKVNVVTKLGTKNITSKEAIEIAKNKIGVTELRQAASFEKEVLIKEDKAYQVYKINIQYNTPEIGNWDVYVETSSGEVVKVDNNIRYDGAVTGSGTAVDGTVKALNLYQSGTIYQLKDVTKPMTGQITSYTANNAQVEPGTLATSTSTTISDKAEVSAHYYAGMVYDFYKNLFNRNSINNSGMNIISTVHYGSKYNNAFWDGTQMVYGDGDGTQFTYLSGDLDVVAHEMTHGVDSSTANLNYQDQPGALNESLSDIFGVLIETYDKYNVKGGGTWTFNTADWVVGDDVYTPGTSGDALRSLANPGLYGQPSTMSGYVNTTSDYGGVHTNSGIPNKAAYLIAQSIGCDKTARIYYRALTNYFISTTDFSGSKSGLVQAATDLYGASGAEVSAINSAYTTVGIGSSAQDTYEPNNTISQAYAINFDQVYNSYIFSSSDIDYYKVSPTSAGSITVNLTNLPADYDLYLVNSSGTVLAQSINGGTTSESLTYSNSAAGTYYIKVIGYNGAYSTTQAYNLKATFSGSSVDPYEPNDSTSTAYAIISGTTYNAYIYSSTDVDYYKISKTTSGTISISLTNLPGDYDLYLRNSSGTIVAYSENAGTTSESISYSASSGTYYVEVVGYNGAYSKTTKYALKATF